MVDRRDRRRARSRASVAVALALAAALAVTGCEGGDEGDDAAPATTQQPAPTTTVPAAARLCAAPKPQQIGTILDPAILELSGLAASRAFDGIYWANNDSGDSARIFAIQRDGATRAELSIDGAEAVDWEDIAIDESTVYVGDIGDNNSARANITIYEVPEPDVSVPDPPTAVDDAVRHDVTYEDGAHNAETLMVDPIAHELVIVTKEPSGRSGIYTTSQSDPDVFRRAGEVNLGIAQLATAGDISADGHVIVVRTYGDVFVWDRAEGESVRDAMQREPCSAPAPSEQQGEAIALEPDGAGFVTASEGAAAALFRVSPNP
jgi:hypothetical protein